MNRGRGRWMAVPVMAATLVASVEAFAVPPRRLARRGVVVTPQPPSDAVVVPVPGVPPAVVGPALRPRRRMVMQPGMLVVPATPGTAAAPSRAAIAGTPASPAPTTSLSTKQTPTPANQPTQAAAPAVATKGMGAATATRPGGTVPESIPAPLPTPAEPRAGRATVAQPTALAESVAFTPAWHAEHPEAWRPGSATDLWKTADEATVAAWLGQPVAAAGTSASGDGAVETAVGDADVGADGLRSVLVLPAGHANVGPAASDWLPLGVFAVVPPGTPQDSHAAALQQLAVDRQGTIKGTFYDSMSGAVQPIDGSIDRATLTASWTVGAGGGRFTAPVRSFVGQPRSAVMTIGGRQRAMELVPTPRP